MKSVRALPQIEDDIAAGKVMEKRDQECLAEEIWRLYVVDGTHWYCQNSGGGWSHVKKPLSLPDLQAHLKGDMTVGLPSPWNGRAKFLTIDVDTVEDDNLGRLATWLRELGVQHLLSFSGNKGYHADIPVKESGAREVARTGGLLSRFLSQQGVAFDAVFPAGTGLSGKTAGGANVKLPLGRHRRTGRFCYYLDEYLVPVSDPLPALRSLEPADVGDLARMMAESLHLDVETGEVKRPWESYYPNQLHYKPCVNVLWQEGLQAPNTRHSATMVVGIAVASNKAIRKEDKKAALIEWVGRMYWPGVEKGYIHESTSLAYAMEEACRLYEAETSRGYGVTCKNPPLRQAMESACKDPVGCHIGRNGGNLDFALLRRLGVFNPSNSREPGVGRSAGFIYLAHQDIAEEHAGKHFQYEGMDVYAAPLAMLRELSPSSEKTVKDANKALCDIGLVVKVPNNEVPNQIRKHPAPGQKYVLQASFYCLPDLTEDYIRDVVLPRARSYRG